MLCNFSSYFLWIDVIKNPIYIRNISFWINLSFFELLLISKLSPQMAWDSSEEQALTHLHKHLSVASTTLKEDVVFSVQSSLFNWRLGWYHDYWTTDKGVTVVTVFGDDHLEKNLKLALVKEMVGMAPDHYCVLDSDLPDFEHRLMQVLKHLPSHKVCLYPPRISLGGPFSVPPWDTIGRLICARPSFEDRTSVICNHMFQEDEVDSFVAGFLR